MKQALHVLNIVTNGQGLTAVTDPVCRWVAEQRIATGLLTIAIAIGAVVPLSLTKSSQNQPQR